MEKKHAILAVAILFVIMAAPVFAQAPSVTPQPSPTPSPSPAPAGIDPNLPAKDALNQFRKANGLENWNFDFDVTGLERGTYNIIIRSTDKAGNIRLSDPVNILIDPDSDLPVVSITSPVNNQRVGGSVLNIVGTCIDDDSVAKVEIKIDEADFVSAQGTDFWSYSFSTEKMPDGPHTITVRGIDVNSVEGQPAQRVFQIDTQKPAVTITSAQSGVLFSGSRELSGYVKDLNGIDGFWVSSDRQATFKPQSTDYKKEENQYQFKLSIDTKQIPDGPAVYWFKGRDTTGSTGLSAFLFFVDNKNPAFEILTPKADERVGAKFMVVGKAHDEIGLASLSWETGKDKGDIQLIPGNPYWFKEFDFSGSQAVEEAINFTLTDTTGNKQVVRVPIKIDREADKPVVTVAFPQANSVVSGKFSVYGHARDTDGVKEIRYSIDGKEAAAVPATQSFVFELADVAAGKHKLTVRAIDVNGTAGNSVDVEFVQAGTDSVIRITEAKIGTQAQGFYPGMVITKYTETKLSGLIGDNGGFKSATYSLQGGEQKPLSLGAVKDGSRQFELLLAGDIPYGIVRIAISATDNAGRSFAYETFVYVTNYTRIFDKPAVSVAMERGNTSGDLELGREFPLRAFFIGDKISSVTLDPATESFGITQADGQITINAKGLGSGVRTKIKVTTVNNEVFYSDILPLQTVADFSNPLLQYRLDSVVTPGGTVPFYPGIMLEAFDGRAKIEGVCSTLAVKAEVSFNNKEFRGIEVRRDKDNPLAALSFTVPKELPFGKNEMTIRFTDKGGFVAENRSFFFRIDAAKGSAEDAEGFYLIDSRIDGANKAKLSKDEPLVGFWNGRDIKSVTIKPPVAFLQASFEGSKVVITATGEGTSQPAAIEITTVAGKTYTSKQYQFFSDTIAPVITITSPKDEQWVAKTITIEGTATDATGIKEVQYALNDPATLQTVSTKSATGGVAFTQSINLETAPDGPLVVFVKATDSNGNSATRIFALKKDTVKAAISLISPQEEQAVNGLFSVTGLIKDDGSIKSIEWSDDGSKYTPVATTGMAFAHNLDLAQYKQLPAKFYIRVTDMSGNVEIYNPKLNINMEADKPVAEVQIPEDKAVLRNDFTISGMVFDDDGVGAIYYRIDKGEFVKLEGASSFSIPVALASIADNEHTMEVQAEDTNGLKGAMATRTFYVSKAEPVSTLIAPEVKVTARGTIELKGKSSDANGIKEVWVSFDNGNSYARATGKDDWTYRLNTALVPDGVHRILVKAVDMTDTEGLYATMLNVDNTLPEVSLDFPYDGQEVTGKLLADGRAFDNIVINSCTLFLSPLEGGQTQQIKLPVAGVFSYPIDTSTLKTGWYNVRIEVRDKADNVSYITRNIVIKQKTVVNRIEQIFPVPGESVTGFFTVSGRVISESRVKAVELVINDKPLKTADVSEYGFFHMDMVPEDLADGEYTMELRGIAADGTVIKAEKQTLRYVQKGLWVRINNFFPGDFVTSRPWMKGEAGYYIQPVGKENADAYKIYERNIAENKIERIEISFDNGRSFENIGGGEKWNYRLQTQNIPDGDVRIIVRVISASGAAVCKTLLVNDDRPPVVRVLNPEEGQRFNDKIRVVGVSTDENRIAEISVNLRRGDKGGYSVPEFIQGMYLDFQGLGATAGHVGLGLTFFDQNVKLQIEAGYALPENLLTGKEAWPNGLVFGARLIASVFKLPFESFLGPDWEFFGMSLGVGAAFSYFTNSGEEITFTEDGLIFGAALVQFEFANLSVPGWSVFNNFGFYAQGEYWFISSAVGGGGHFNVSFGLRVRLL